MWLVNHSALPSALLLLGGCVQLQPRPPLPEETALRVGDGTQLDMRVVSAQASHSGQSGCRLL
jgi:hypothetical protein